MRDPDTGAPTGLLLEAAAWELVNPIIPKPSIKRQRETLRRAEAHCVKYGLTAVGAMEYAHTVRDILDPMRDDMMLRCRVTALDRTLPLDLAWINDIPADDRLAVIGCKAFVDGTLGSRTARMLADYCDDPGNRGLLVELAKDGVLNDWAREVAAHDLSPSIHAIGDEAVRLALDAAEKVPDHVRPRIEHAQHIAPDDLPRFAGRIASMQPLHRADDGRYAERRVGRDRLAGGVRLPHPA